jgi:hypothetical protein
MKVDLCTWTKNGSKTLIPVLKRIDRVIPAEEVGEKIAVDDSSVDSTVKILKEFNWKVYPNRRGFINGGTTEALSHVRSKFFVSVEQDVLLCSNWWDIVPKHMVDKTVAVAQGVEISTNSAERGIEKLILKKVKQIPLEKRASLWKTIGNNIYRSEIIRKLGFVDDSTAMRPFYEKITAHGFKWITDINAVSTHIHGDIFNAVRHTVTFYGQTQESTYLDKMRTYRYLAGLAFSPLKGLKLAIETKEPQVQLLYILRKLALTPAFFQRKQRRLYNLKNQKPKLTKQ